MKPDSHKHHANSKKTEALLLIASDCAYCPAIISHLSTLLKEASIAKLEILNIQQYPDIAATFNVRSVPWLKLGDYILTGSYSLDELRHWIQLNNSEAGPEKYIEQQLADGELDKIIHQVKQYPQWLKAVIHLLENDDTAMQVRLAIDSIMENMAGTEILQSQVDKLGQLTQTAHPSKLADIIYYLGLSKSPEAIIYLEKFLQHDNPDIIETTKDSLEEIHGIIKNHDH